MKLLFLALVLLASVVACEALGLKSPEFSGNLFEFNVDDADDEAATFHRDDLTEAVAVAQEAFRARDKEALRAAFETIEGIMEEILEDIEEEEVE